jgi:hypothetical protein
MEAASAMSVTPASKNKRVTLGGGPVAAATVGVVIGIVGMFLKAFNTPAEWTAGGWNGNTTYISTTGAAKVLLGSLVIGLIFLLIARGVHRKGVLWGTYIFGVIAIAIGVLNAAGGFTLTGSSVKANASIGVFIALVGAVIMFVSAIAARQSAKPVA